MVVHNALTRICLHPTPKFSGFNPKFRLPWWPQQDWPCGCQMDITLPALPSLFSAHTHTRSLEKQGRPPPLPWLPPLRGVAQALRLPCLAGHHPPSPAPNFTRTHLSPGFSQCRACASRYFTCMSRCHSSCQWVSLLVWPGYNLEVCPNQLRVSLPSALCFLLPPSLFFPGTEQIFLLSFSSTLSLNTAPNISSGNTNNFCLIISVWYVCFGICLHYRSVSVLFLFSQFGFKYETVGSSFYTLPPTSHYTIYVIVNFYWLLPPTKISHCLFLFYNIWHIVFVVSGNNTIFHSFPSVYHKFLHSVSDLTHPLDLTIHRQTFHYMHWSAYCVETNSIYVI